MMSSDDCTKGWYSRCAMAVSPVSGCSCKCGGENHSTLRPGARDIVKMPLTPVKVFSVHQPKCFLPGFLVRPDIYLRRGMIGKVETNVIRRYAYHSPDGFEWGYSGSGPADLALNILGMFIPAFWAWHFHHRYKDWTVAGIPKEGAIISSARTVLWIVEQYEKESITDLSVEV